MSKPFRPKSSVERHTFYELTPLYIRGDLTIDLVCDQLRRALGDLGLSLEFTAEGARIAPLTGHSSRMH